MSASLAATADAAAATGAAAAAAAGGEGGGGLRLVHALAPAFWVLSLQVLARVVSILYFIEMYCGLGADTSGARARMCVWYNNIIQYNII